MTPSEALAIRERMLEGSAWIDEQGNLRTVEPRAGESERERKRRLRIPTRPEYVLSVEQLIKHFEPTGASTGANLDALRDRIREERERHEAKLRQIEAASATDFQATMARMLDKIGARREAREKLPCYPLDPRAVPGELGRSDDRAADACEASRAFVDCPFAPPRGHSLDCPRSRVEGEYERVARNLRGVPAGYADPVLASLHGRRDATGKRVPPVALERRPALLIVQHWLSGRGGMAFGRQWTGEELILILGGAMRAGKSTALAWALAERGGRFVTSKALCDLSFDEYDVNEWLAPPVLVIDEIGGETLTEVGRARLLEVVKGRYAACLRTALSSNLPRRDGPDGRTFVSRYDERMNKLVAESGAWLNVGEWA